MPELPAEPSEEELCTAYEKPSDYDKMGEEAYHKALHLTLAPAPIPTRRGVAGEGG